jgi:hypothetical protein
MAADPAAQHKEAGMAGTSQVGRLRALALPAVEDAGLVLEEMTVLVGRRRCCGIWICRRTSVVVSVDAVTAASQAIRGLG